MFTKPHLIRFRMAFRTILFGLSIFFLIGCAKTVEYTVTLYDGEEIVDVFVVSDQESITLPTLENKEEFVFAAWTDHQAYYYDSFDVTGNLDLYAFYETAADVFDFGVNPENQTMLIEGYRGIAKHLTIPQKINDYLVTSIGSYSFQDSTLISVQIPVDAGIGMFAFQDSKELRSVSFYGRYLELRPRTLAAPDYLDTLADYPDACQIVSGSVESGTWEFGEGCPIQTVLEKSAVIVIAGIEYYHYRVLWDMNVEGNSPKLSIQSQAFFGAINLERVSLPKDESILLGDAFEGCPKLVDIIIPEENAWFTTVDHVVYSKDLSILILYPNGLTSEVFEIPESVTTIRSHAFMGNTSIKELIISENVDQIELSGLLSLVSITVDASNPVFTAMDGVLFRNNMLVKYPAMKTGAEYILPASTTTISSFAFQGNQFLTKITLNDGLRSIGDQCFIETKSLLELDLPHTVELIGGYNFMDSSVTTLIIRRSVIVDGSVTQIYLLPLFSGGSDYEIFVPDDSLAAYRSHPRWSQLQDHFFAMSTYTEE
jgi:hypothetical protein